MILSLRKQFNSLFTDDKHALLLKKLDAACGTRVDFRVSETPCFFPRELLDSMEQAGSDLIHQILSNKDYLKKSGQMIPEPFRVGRQDAHPLFVSVDFGLVRDGHGNIVPKLIELQGFPTLYGYQVLLCDLYKDVHGLSDELTSFLGGLNKESYVQVMREAIAGAHEQSNVILMELDPFKQKTLPDFNASEKMFGVTIVNIRDVLRDGRSLYYVKNGRRVPIHRIYNRVIADELMRSNIQLPFDFRDDVDAEWAGHPNWFFHISKFSIPFLHHDVVPKTVFLSEMNGVPDNLEQWVLKPLFSFAGVGVKVGPTREEIISIPEERRHEYVLQEKVEYGDVIDSPFGGTKAEVRIMYVWDKELRAVNNLVRMGRGKMMGVDHNRNMMWVGGSAGLYIP